MLYTFSIEEGHLPLVKIVVDSDIVEKDSYLKSLIEKCFERIFQAIGNDKKEEVNSDQEIDLEDD